MKFLKLQVENFMAIASAEVELDQRGLVLIQGVNSGDTSAASNGAGKSTLMNSLMWCLYGETAHGVKGDDVLSTGHEKNCRVMVTVEDEGKKYAIIRHRKHKEFKNRLIVRGEDGDMTKGKDTLTQTFVERLIGASKEVFMASIYASQEAMPDLPGMSDKSLKTIVEEAAGVDRLTRAYAIARERANAAAARMDVTKSKMDACLTLIETAQSEIEAAKASSESWERDRGERLDKARADLAGAEVTLSEVEMEIRSLPEQIRDTENAIAGERSNPPYSKITPWIDAAIREQARGVTTVMLIPQSLDTQWYERAAECANETVILSGGRVAFVEPDVELGLVEVNINPGGSMLLIFRGYCQEAGHTISKIPLAVMKKLGGYDPANVVRKKRPRKKAA